MQKFLRYKVDHLLFWIATIAFHVYTRADVISQAGFLQFLGEVVIRNGLLAIIIYLNLLFLIPRFAHKGKWVSYGFLVLAEFLFYVLVKNAHDVYLSSITPDGTEVNFLQNTFYNLSIAIFYMAFALALYLSREWFVQQELIRRIEIEKINTELEYLKAQLNPHFLFNSLNTIFFQIDRNNTRARDSLAMFSDMLRYQLYECNGQEITVEKELSYIRNYVDLQRLRLDDKYWISYIDHNVSECKIAPLLLIPFIENAFKHVSHFPKDNEIRIDLWRDEKALRMVVFNTYDSAYAGHSNGHGIGLKNVQRRLALLYPDQHSLEFQRNANSYQVNLEIKIR